MNLFNWIANKKLKKVGAVKDESTDSGSFLVNDRNNIKKWKLECYNVWYEGDEDELLRFYTNQVMFNLPTEPFYSRNQRAYFWNISATETDVKRTHSGQPRNIIDTLVNIMGIPEMHSDEASNERLKTILEANDFVNVYLQEQMPLTLVEGWGAYKISWDLDEADYPVVLYYRADECDFIKRGNNIIGIIFKDYYTDGEKRYLLTETRTLRGKDLIIEKEAFEVISEKDEVKKVNIDDVDIFKGIEPLIEVKGIGVLLAVPCVIFKDTSRTGLQGRSIFTGKISLFDDLDQALSQGSNSVRRSTPIEYFNSDYMEKDITNGGLPKMPHVYDRKYTMYTGGRDANGGSIQANPVQVSQPQIEFSKYSEEAKAILLQIVNGIMSPATLGIDISKKDNAEAQREKEKVTIFTRNRIISVETKILHAVLEQSLIADEIMHTDTVSRLHYDISVKFDEFADDSYENKIAVLGDAYAKDVISDKMYISKLYGDKLSEEDKNYELQYLQKYHPQPSAMQSDEMLMGGEEDGDMEQL